MTIVFLFLLVTLATAGCAPKRVATTPSLGEEIIALLRDDETHAVGHAHVSTSSDSLVLERALSAAHVAGGVLRMDELTESEVQDLFGDALAALPPAPYRFTLYFRFDSEELTDESRALVPQILEVVVARPLVDVLVIGHTDTEGSDDLNFQLGLRRAVAVRRLITSAGLDAADTEIASHGEHNLLVQTEDNVPEPLNRRVEVVVR